MGAPRAALNPATLSVGFSVKLATVQSISADGQTAVTVDRQNTQTSVTMLVQRSKGPLPAVGETWLLAQDLGMWTFAAIVASSTGQFIGGSSGSTGNGHGITVSAIAPATPQPGDVWVSASAGNAVFAWSGTTWIPAPLGTQALSDHAVTAAKIAPGAITAAQISPTAGITAGQVAFTVRDIGGVRVITGTSQPPAAGIGDLWINPAVGNQLSVWDGGRWESIQFGAPAIASGSLTSAQLSPLAGLTPGQVNFTARDIGGITTSIQALAPANPAVGDLWFDASNSFALKQWNGTIWAPYQFGTQAIAAGSVTAALIAANTITAAQIAAGTITAAQIQAGSLTSSVIGNLGSVLNKNPFFSGGSLTGWTFTGGSSIALVSGGTLPAGAPYQYAVQWVSPGPAGAAVATNDLFSVAANQNYLITAWVYSNTATPTVGVDWRNNGAYVSTSTPAVTVPVNTWTPVAVIVTCPSSGVNQAAVRVGANSAATVYAQAVQAFPQIPGGLLATGTVTAQQIAANTITAAQIAAGTITAAQIQAGSLTSGVIGSLGLCLNSNPFFAGGSSAGWFVSGTGATMSVLSPSALAAAAPAPSYPNAYGATFTVTAGGGGNKLSGGNDKFGITLGNAYLASAWLYSPTAVSVAFDFEFRNSAGSIVSTIGPVYALAANTWTFVTANVTPTSANAPAAVTGNLVFIPQAAATVYVQGAQAFPQVPGIVDATTITGATLIADGTSGDILVYSGPPAAGNLIATLSPVAGTDGQGNPYKAYFVVYDNAGGTSYVQMAPGSPAGIFMATGDAIEATPAKVTTQVIGGSTTRVLASVINAPRITGQPALETAQVLVESPSADLSSTPAQVVISAAGSAAFSTASVVVKPLNVAITGGGFGVGTVTITANAGTTLTGGLATDGVTITDGTNTWTADHSITLPTTHTVGNTTTAGVLSDSVTIPGGNANAGTELIIETVVKGTYEGQTLNFGIMIDLGTGNVYTNVVPVSPGWTVGHTFAGKVRLHVMVKTTGISGTADIWTEGELTDSTVARSPATTVAVDGLLTAQAFDTTSNFKFATGFTWSATTTGETITGQASTATRRGA